MHPLVQPLKKWYILYTEWKVPVSAFVLFPYAYPWGQVIVFLLRKKKKTTRKIFLRNVLLKVIFLLPSPVTYLTLPFRLGFFFSFCLPQAHVDNIVEMHWALQELKSEERVKWSQSEACCYTPHVFLWKGGFQYFVHPCSQLSLWSCLLPHFSVDSRSAFHAGQNSESSRWV